MNNQHNWHELKVEFMTGDYKSLSEFARKREIPYNGNFKKRTKGWVSERDTILAQMCYKITEDSMGKKAEEFVRFKQEIDEASAELFSLVDDFIKNKHYSKFPVKQRIDGINSVDTVELDYIKINDVNKAVNSLNKLHKILKKAYPSLAKATGC